MDPKKNVALLIEAIALMDREVTLQVAGRGDPEFESELMQLAKRSLQGRVEFVGAVPHLVHDFSNGRVAHTGDVRSIAQCMAFMAGITDAGAQRWGR